MAMSKELEEVQKEIIRIHREIFDESPTPMKLQKLCYYAQGFCLALGRGIFDDDFQAWQHGPVIPALYTRYRDYQWKQITEDVGDVNSAVRERIFEIVHAYGRYDGAALSTMTHRESPWKDARGDLPETDGSTAVIPKESIQAFFGAKLKAYGEAK